MEFPNSIDEDNASSDEEMGFSRGDTTSISNTVIDI
jgi:hypothetical protein